MDDVRLRVRPSDFNVIVDVPKWPLIILGSEASSSIGECFRGPIMLRSPVNSDLRWLFLYGCHRIHLPDIICF
jgi:hypothetical protein